MTTLLEEFEEWLNEMDGCCGGEADRIIRMGKEKLEELKEKYKQ